MSTRSDPNEDRNARLCRHCVNAAFSLVDEFHLDLNVRFDPSSVHFDPFLGYAFLGGRRLENRGT